jgi:hypothetical protein
MNFDQITDAQELLDELSVKIYEPPLNALHDRLRTVPEALQTIVLFLNFDTELAINGIMGFVENSSGAYLAETIVAFDRLGACQTAATLREIDRVLAEHGLNHERLREDLAGRVEYEVVTFRDVHGPDAMRAASHVQSVAQDLYINRVVGAEDPYELAKSYVSAHRGEILAAIADAAN